MLCNHPDPKADTICTTTHLKDLKLKLAGSSETFLRDFQDSLRNAKDAASSDLKRQVFRNYQEFITISKEIATLENDMLELKELLGEWRTLPQALELEEGGVANFGCK